MRNKVIITALLLICCACKKGKKALLVQEKNINGFSLSLQYLPSDDKALLRFRLNINNSNGSPLKNTDHVRFNYGLDTLFSFVNVKDTLHPVDVIRVANGNMNGIEYLLLFNRPHAFSQVNCELVFKDWLFTNQLMSFPLEGSAIAHVDSFNQQI
ncbi:hypothetical protein SIO70_17415 [Chitinophaga sancti]|uniref:hypothetical protein n=1 Tax=Chitinophaga sancti TaxID=1004 RepID=UPI002A751433|nr:hypothetical protein [Chitinophaga sancti]WPQ60124.1 hypothetical protein SIO70_17415 [Chitinophaga sancti]